MQLKAKKTRSATELTEAERMRPAREVAAERALERQLRELHEKEEESASEGSDTEAMLVGELRRLAPPVRAEQVRLPEAAALVKNLELALRPSSTHLPRNERRLRTHLTLVQGHPAYDFDTSGHWVMEQMERALRSSDGKLPVEPVLLVSWLALAVVWRAPRLPTAHRALLALLPRLNQTEVEEVSRALRAALPDADDLMLLSDALPPAAALHHPLLHAALDRVAGGSSRCEGPGAQCAEGVAAELGAQWGALSARQRLVAARLASRLLLGAARSHPQEAALAARRLHATHSRLHTHRDRDPDHMKVSTVMDKMTAMFEHKNMK